MFRITFVVLTIALQTESGQNLIEWVMEWIYYFFSLGGRLSYMTVPFVVLISCVLIAIAAIAVPSYKVLRGQMELQDILRGLPLVLLVFAAIMIIGGCALSSFTVFWNFVGQISQVGSTMPGGEFTPTWPSPP